MIYTNYQLDNSAIELPITSAARSAAQMFASQQTNTAKAEQVKLNTLAVLVVNDYLEMMGIPTNLEASDSWNSIVRFCADVADLEVAKIGRLECRPVTAHQSTCLVPPETWEERVGYVVVQIDDSLQEAKILGFSRKVTSEELPLNKLQPVEALIDTLDELSVSPIQPLVDLSQWFSGIIESGWQTVESILAGRPELAPAFRSVNTLERNAPEQVESNSELIIRAKVIDVNTATYNYAFMLVVEISPEANQRTSVNIQLHATGNQVHLPLGVNLSVLDHSGAVVLEAQARHADNYIQLAFSGEPQEKFSVQVALDDTIFLSNFMI
ncbi:MAG TPA: DUF1822 family protein [Nostocaceae cyanobacterium]|nr:DUF1822 family protein [Nostocaceae cyanobacterium]